MYDVIIVGARCAGSPTAMLLAQKGYKVLLVDKASFPSDIISTHIIWPPGTERLTRWGLLEKVAATNAPLIGKVSFDVGPFALSGSPPPFDGVSACYAPRRAVLDKILVDAAVEAGAEVRENCPVEEIVMEGERVTGIRCRTNGGSAVAESARMVIGADGKHSIVARAVKPEEYNVKPKLSCSYYTYWSGVPTEGIEFYMRPERAIGCIPTNDGLICMPVVAPQKEFERFRSDIEGNYMRSLDLAPDLAERVNRGTREERFIGTGDLTNFFRKPFGPGWALVGDAGYDKDPIGAQGISNAFRDAGRLAEALDQGFSEKVPLDEGLAEYERNRNEEVMPMYEFNSEMAAVDKPPPPELQQLFAALRGNQADMDRFFGVLAGTVPVPEFFAPENTNRIVSAAAGVR